MANITLLNTSSDLSSKTVITRENPYTITGLHTFDRDPSAPFAVTSGSAVVANLDADKLDGIEAAAFAQLAVAPSFTASPISLTATAADAYLSLASSGGSGRTWAMKSKTTGTLSFDNDLTAALVTISSVGVLTVTGGIIANGTASSGVGTFVSFQKNGTQAGIVGTRSTIIGSGSSSDVTILAETGNGISFMVNGSTTQTMLLRSDGVLDYATTTITDPVTSSHAGGFVASGAYFGESVGKVLTTPTVWATIISGGTIYKIPCYAS